MSHQFSAQINEKFYTLPKEKQQNIINAGLEVFSKNEYKKASTDEMAAKAGISKGLLFHYFKNKKTFYFFLFEYAINLLEDLLQKSNITEEMDFFRLLEKGGALKAKLIEQHPCMLDFSMGFYYSEKEEVSEEVVNQIQKKVVESYGKYFTQIDYSKFKPEVNPVQIMNMIKWMAEGYLNELRRTNQPIVMEEILAEYKSWSDMFRTIAYKEDRKNE